VETAEREKAVVREMNSDTTRINNALKRPAFPTAQPVLRNRMGPNMDRMVGRKTPSKVPNLLTFSTDKFYFMGSSITGKGVDSSPFDSL